MPIQAFQTNIVKTRYAIINAGNFKQDKALQDSVFPFGYWRVFNSWNSVFPFSYWRVFNSWNIVFPFGCKCLSICPTVVPRLVSRHRQSWCQVSVSSWWLLALRHHLSQMTCQPGVSQGIRNSGKPLGLRLPTRLVTAVIYLGGYGSPSLQSHCPAEWCMQAWDRC